MCSEVCKAITHLEGCQALPTLGFRCFPEPDYPPPTYEHRGGVRVVGLGVFSAPVLAGVAVAADGVGLMRVWRAVAGEEELGSDGSGS